ncbi:MAG: 3-dehydroquinate synthase [Oscillospiraceae bacterium]|nr:3-dehydroquinate synthase [Oscillospiraceae bacterium]
MEKLHLDPGENSYDIIFEKDWSYLLKGLEDIGAPKKLLVVTDTNVDKLYAGEVCRILENSGYIAAKHIFAAGEENKNMDSILGICKSAAEHKLDRKSMMIALGGGVTGDMTGFAAAIYMRGIRFVQIPTTLLAQSDSSVGGKTGVDFAGSKNILGSFHQPSLVYINVSVLKTLPEKEFISGMGEVIKHGIIYDSEFFDYLTGNSEKVKSLDEDTLIKMSVKNCSIKADVVTKDEKEHDLRAILNFGHTIGHAAESSFNFTETHGACVGLGMCAASYIAYRRGMIDKDVFEKIISAEKLYGLPVSHSGTDPDAVYGFMKNDKKKDGDILKFILPEKIGKVVQKTDVTKDEIYAALEYIKQK